MPHEPDIVAESRPVSGWLFVGPERRMYHEPHDLIVANGVYRVDRPCFCWWGLEPSETPIDAVMNARGSVCCRVSAWGEVVRGVGRFVASSVRVEWVEDAGDALRSFAVEQGAPAWRPGDPHHLAAVAIRVATIPGDMPATKAARDRAERAVKDGLNERLAARLMGLAPGR